MRPPLRKGHQVLQATRDAAELPIHKDGVWGWGDDFMTFSDIVTIVMHGQDRGSQQLLVTERMEGPTEPTWQEGNHHQV